MYATRQSKFDSEQGSEPKQRMIRIFSKGTTFVYHPDENENPIVQAQISASKLEHDSFMHAEIKGRKMDSPPVLIVKEREEIVRPQEIRPLQPSKIAKQQPKVSPPKSSSLPSGKKNLMKAMESKKIKRQKPSGGQGFHDILDKIDAEDFKNKTHDFLNQEMGDFELAKRKEEATHKRAVSKDRQTKSHSNLFSGLPPPVSAAGAKRKETKSATRTNGLKKESKTNRIRKTERSTSGKKKKEFNQTLNIIGNSAHFANLSNHSLTPEKGPRQQSQHLLNSEVGRGANGNFYQNGRTKSSTSIAAVGLSQQKQPPVLSKAQQVHPIKEAGNIDRLIQRNLKKMKVKAEKEIEMKKKSEGEQKRKKDQLKEVNQHVREINKTKTYRKKDSTQQTMLLAPENGNQAEPTNITTRPKFFSNTQNDSQFNISQEIEGIKSHYKLQSQRLERPAADRRALHRQSHGLDFLEVRKEIESELKTIQEKYKEETKPTLKQFQESPHLKIKRTQKEVKVEKSTSQRQAPIQKIVIKKNKIKQFIKTKKREHQLEKLQKRRQEIVQVIKVHENLSKLNNLCKKKVGVTNSLDGKKNTARGINIKESQQSSSGKKIGKIPTTATIPIEEEDSINPNDTSAKSDFYEEYFRLINSIHKEQQTLQHPHQNPTSDIKMKSPSSSQIIKSHSPGSFLRQPQFGSPQDAKPPKAKKPPKKGIKKPSKSRAESAPLLIKKHGGSGNASTIASRLSGKEMNSSQKFSKQRLFEQIEQKIQNKQAAQSSNRRQLLTKVVEEEVDIASPASMADLARDSENEQLALERYFIHQIIKIQRAYKGWLFNKGFYSQRIDLDGEEELGPYEEDEIVESPVTEIHHDQESEDEEELQQEQNLEEEDEEEDFASNPLDDHQKVVYLSNLNSCSTPESPKLSPKEVQQPKRDIPIKTAFEYHTDPAIGMDEEEKQEMDYRLRLFTGSESLVREFRHQTPKAVHTDPVSSHHSSQHQYSVDSIKKSDQTSHSSVFDRNSFQQFTMSKLNSLMANNDFAKLIELREKALTYREQTEDKFISKMLKNNNYSPRTYHTKKQELEKWVQLEKEEIQKTKKAYEQEWEKTASIINETQKNAEKMKKELKINIDNNMAGSRNSQAKHAVSEQLVALPLSSSRSSECDHRQPFQEEEATGTQNISDISQGLAGELNDRILPPEEEDDRSLSRSKAENDLKDLVKNELNSSWKKSSNDEIRIQENYFDDEIEDEDNLASQLQAIDGVYSAKPFSIEDFKQLDKQMLMAEDALEDDAQEEAHDESGDLLSSSLLFQNAKPGENIRISDIFKKESHSTSMNDQSLIQTQQQQTLQQEQEKRIEQEVLADQITEDLLVSLLGTEVDFPKRMTEPSELLNEGDIFVIDAQLNERERRREVVEIRSRMNMEVDLALIDRYVNEIFSTLFTEETDKKRRAFLEVLTKPIQKNELEVLNMLQTSEIGSYEHFETSMEIQTNPILAVDLYLEIERQREEEMVAAGTTDSSIIAESEHIHNKAFFDSVNESLAKFRPYGLLGEPMPFSNKSRRLHQKVDIESVDTERLFQLVKQDLFRWSSQQVGALPSQVFAFGDETQEIFDEELFQETRERRLAGVLSQEVVENEYQWLNYDFEEIQVKIDLSDMLLEHLVEEVVGLLQKNK